MRTLIPATIVAVLGGAAIGAPATWTPISRYGDAVVISEERIELPIHVTEAGGIDRAAFPVKGGIPFPKGALRSANQVRLLAPDGNEVPTVRTIISHWTDGSIRWLWLDFFADVEANATAAYRLEAGKGVRPRPFPSRLKVEQTSGGIAIDTGALRCHLAAGMGGFPDRIEVGGAAQSLLRAPIHGFIEFLHGDCVGDESERRERADTLKAPATLSVEENNGLRVVVRAEGWHVSDRRRQAYPYIVRFIFYSGKPYVLVRHTFIHTGDTATTFVRSMGLRVPVELSAEAHVSFSAAPKPVGVQLGGKRAYLFQRCMRPLSYPDYTPPKLACEIGRDEKVLSRGERATGWMEARSIGVALKYFWEEFPKGIAADGAKGTLAAHFWPPDHPDPMDLRRLDQRWPFDYCRAIEDPDKEPWYRYQLRVYCRRFWKTRTDQYRTSAHGTAKSHDVGLCFAGEEPGLVARALTSRLSVFVTPEYNCATGALGPLHPEDDANFPTFERYFRWGFDGVDKSQRELFLGMWHFGDMQQMDQGLYNARFSWTNSEVEVPHGVFIQYFRTGRRVYFDMLERGVRHMMDVDSHLYDPEHTWASGGNTRHDQSQWGAHKTGLAGSHTYGHGLVDFYQIAGDLHAKEILLRYGRGAQRHPDFVAAMAGPKQFFSKCVITRETDQLCRLMANLWEVTEDQQWRERLQRLIDVQCIGLGFSYSAADNTLRFSKRHGVGSGREVHRLYLSSYRALALPYVAWLTEDQALLGALARASDAVLNWTPPRWSQRSAWIMPPALLYEQTGNTRYAITCARALRRWFYREPRKGGYVDKFWGLPASDRATERSWQRFPSTDGGFQKPVYGMRAAYRAKLKTHPEDPRGYFLPDPHPCAPPSTPLVSADVETTPIDVAALYSRSPYDPWREHPRRRAPKPFMPLKPGEIGFDFGPRPKTCQGYLPVTRRHVFPATADMPDLDRGLVGLPYGAGFCLRGVHFRLPCLAETEGNGCIVVGRDQSVSIPVGCTCRRVYALGGVCRRASYANEVVARYVVHCRNGERLTFDQRNITDVQPFHNAAYLGEDPDRDLAGKWGHYVLRIHTLDLGGERLVERMEFSDAGTGYEPALIGLSVEADATATRAAPVYSLASPEGPFDERKRGWGWRERDVINSPAGGVGGPMPNTLGLRLEPGAHEVRILIGATTGLKGEKGFLSVEIDGRTVLDSVLPVGWTEFRSDFTAVKDVTEIRFLPRHLTGPTESWWLKRIEIRPIPRSYQRRDVAQKQNGIRYGWLPHRFNSYLQERLHGSGKRLPLGSLVACSFPDELSDREFAAALPNGKYDVTLYASHKGAGPALTTIWAQGRPVWEGKPLPIIRGYRPHELRFAAHVADGQLRLRIMTDYSKIRYTGSQGHWQISAMIVRPGT